MRYKPTMSDEQVERLRVWHEAAYQADARDRDIVVPYLGREFRIPPQVHAIQGMAELLGDTVLEEVRPTDRVLDMGTGCGVNAVLAASRARDVLAVDINPVAVSCAEENAERNGVADRIIVRLSDVFSNVDGTFDLIVFDPPFRWFKPRDLRERGTADENYAALREFFLHVHEHLTSDGRVLLSFGTSGDLDYVMQLVRGASLRSEIIATRDLDKDNQTVRYYTYRLTRAS